MADDEARAAGADDETTNAAEDAPDRTDDAQATKDDGADAAKTVVAEEAAADPEKPAGNVAAGEPLTVFSDSVYACDRQYAIVLAQLMTGKERVKVYAWIERLDKMRECDEMREERDKYLKFLTLALSNRKLVPPFTKVPPPGLRPLSTVMPRSFHNLIFKDKYVTGDCRPPKDVGERTYSRPDRVEPKTFLDRQPVPRDGGFVYAAAFGNRKNSGT